MTKSKDSLLDNITIWGCGTVMGMLASDVVLGSYNAGLSPLKPSHFTLLAVVFMTVVALIQRLRFCPAAFWVLSILIIRPVDAFFFERFFGSGNQIIFMSCMRTLLIVVSMLFVISTPAGMRAVRWAAMLTILLTTFSVVSEFLGVFKFTSIAGRAAGFNGHPNTPPIIICQALGLLFTLEKNFRKNMLFAALSVPGVALTYGRSGMAVLAVLIAAYVLLNARRNLGFLIICSYLAIPLLGVGFTIMQNATGSGARQDKNTSDRLQAIYELDFEKLKSPERAKDLADAWEAVMEKPYIGHGVGAGTNWWAPHNEYVFMWLEQGLPGLIIYCSVVLGLFFRSLLCRGKAMFAVLGYLAYTPIAQGRIMDPHFYLSLLAICYVLWSQRIGFSLRGPATSQSAPSLPSTAAASR